MVNYIPDYSAEENKETMLSEIDNVKTGQVTYAVKNTRVDGFDLKIGTIMGLDSKKILCTGKDLSLVALELIEKMRGNEEMITLYYGKDVPESDAEALKEIIEEKYPSCDVDIHYGGQPIYYYYISLE